MIVGEGKDGRSLENMNVRSDVKESLAVDSGELCGIYVRTGHPGHPAWSVVGYHRVSQPVIRLPRFSR